VSLSPADCSRMISPVFVLIFSAWFLKTHAQVIGGQVEYGQRYFRLSDFHTGQRQREAERRRLLDMIGSETASRVDPELVYEPGYPTGRGANQGQRTLDFGINRGQTLDALPSAAIGPPVEMTPEPELMPLQMPQIRTPRGGSCEDLHKDPVDPNAAWCPSNTWVCDNPQYNEWAAENCKKSCNKCPMGFRQGKFAVPPRDHYWPRLARLENLNTCGNEPTGTPNYAQTVRVCMNCAEVTGVQMYSCCADTNDTLNWCTRIYEFTHGGSVRI